ncbi:MAG: hypothetical protein ACR2MF_09420, partial [Chthoniobacterales bacterium]
TPTPTPLPTATPTPTPVPTPSKYGTPAVITSFNPYPIDSGTVIQTDPAITRQGVTDFGKIYRGPEFDGPASRWMFGATSEFDVASDFDTHFGDSSNYPLAAFKFENLQLLGDPTISTANGGVTNLALISVGNISSGPPGGTLTFAGLDSLLLATQAGSIHLTSDISFQNINSLFVYARGSDSSLTLDSSISGTTDLSLKAEGTVQVNASTKVANFHSGPGTKGGNIKITSGKRSGVAINIGSSAQLLSLLDAASPGPGGKITILASARSGNSSSINIDSSHGGTIRADRGTVDISHAGDSGVINLNKADIRADTIKVGALGQNGVLNIGGGQLSADKTLMLYSPGSNGTINFFANVRLSSGSSTILSGNTITIQPHVLVFIAGEGGPAQIFTNHPNYSGFGGTNPDNGTFGGNGANIPQPLASAPPFH